MHRTLLLAVALATTGMAAQAQMTSEVRFAPGNFGTMVTGSVTGQAYVDHTLGAQGGQEMFADLAVAETDGTGSVYFNILPPGSDGVAIYNGSIDGNTATVSLPEDGTYTIRVYLLGNDADSGKTVSYTLDLSIQ